MVKGLANSPDAKVVSGDEFGIAECKCPEQHKHSDVFDVASSNDNFMLFVVNGKLQL
jgi:hypothetical protein